MKSLIILILFFSLSACNNSEEESGSGYVRGVIAGISNFGKVPLGDYRISGVKFENHTSSSLNLSLSSLVAPFSYDGYAGDCNGPSVAPGKNCIVKIRFSPVVAGEYFQSVTINGKSFSFSGKGLTPGQLSLGASTWSAGTFAAGDLVTTTVSATNIGDTLISTPLVATPTFSIVSHTCGLEILPGENCSITIGAQKTGAQSYNQMIQLYTAEMTSYVEVNFVGNVTPGDPAGTINIVCDKLELIADNADTTTCSIGPVRDDFGNVVVDGVAISASANDLYLDGPTLSNTASGMTSFTVRSSAAIGNGRLIVSSNLASGFIDIPLVSGPPVGTITAKTYQTQIRADGISTVTIETNPMVNGSGITITDGTPLEAVLDASGTIETTQLFSVNGSLRVTVKASTIAETTNLTIRANPTYDMANNITGYQASGTFPITFTPLPTVGNFDISCDRDEIYFETTGSGFPDQTVCNVEDIRDTNSNLVGAGVDVDIALINGVHGVTGQNAFTLTTDSSSSVQFLLEGNSVRDFITIDATINGEYNSHQVFAVGEQVAMQYDNSANQIEMDYSFADVGFDPATDLAPASSKWMDYRESISAIRSQGDSEYFGLKRYAGGFQDSGALLRHLIWDCFVGVRDYVILAPCNEKKKDGLDFNYAPYYAHKIRVEDEASAVINANIPTLPGESAGLGENVLGPISLYDKTNNEIHMIGGIVPTEEGPDQYSVDDTISSMTFGMVTIFAHMPVGMGSYTDDIQYPVMASHSKGVDKAYIFGGARVILAPSRGLELGNTLQVFEQGELQTLSVNPDPSFGTPSQRFLNGAYFDEELNNFYVVGGTNLVGDFLDDVWKVDLSNLPLEWERVCNLCGLPDILNRDVLTMELAIQNTSLSFLEYMGVFESMRPYFIWKNKTSSKWFIGAYRNPTVKEINLETGAGQDPVSSSMQYLSNSDIIYHHKGIDRLYRYKVNTEGVIDSSVEYWDMEAGQSIYYKATIQLDVPARDHALSLTPVISAHSINKTFKTSETVEYGASAYIYNFNNLEWELIGSNMSNSVASLDNSGFNITATYTGNARDYIGSDGKVEILIRPTQEIGNQAGGELGEGEAWLRINHIQLEGVY